MLHRYVTESHKKTLQLNKPLIVTASAFKLIPKYILPQIFLSLGGHAVLGASYLSSSSSITLQAVFLVTHPEPHV